MGNLIVGMTRRQVLHPYGRRPQELRKVFTAYRMGVPTSERMKDALKDLLRAEGVEALDGEVLGGQYWAPEIRRRLKSAGLIVADVTGPSREVVFELGAIGAKPELPIVEMERDLKDVPAWLGGYHLVAYSGTRVTNIAQRAAELVKNKRSGTMSRPSVDPTMMVWLESGYHAWVAEEKARLKERCRQLSVDFVEASARTHNAPEDVRGLQAAWIVVSVMSGSSEDTLGHYLIGDVVARPTTVGNKGPRRFAVAICETEILADQFVAGSVRNLPAKYCQTIVPNELGAVLAPRFESLRQFRAGRRG